MTDPERPAPGISRVREMTVANIRENAGADHVDVVFLESARFYRLERRNPDFDRMLGLLRDALARGSLIEVELAAAHGDLIHAVRERGAHRPGAGLQTD